MFSCSEHEKIRCVISRSSTFIKWQLLWLRNANFRHKQKSNYVDQLKYFLEIYCNGEKASRVGCDRFTREACRNSFFKNMFLSANTEDKSVEQLSRFQILVARSSCANLVGVMRDQRLLAIMQPK